MSRKLRFKKSKKININKDGSEAVSSKPTELRAKINSPVTLRQKMTSMWKEFQIKEQERNEIETIIDAQDFDVSNDSQPVSPYEVENELADQLDYDESQSFDPSLPGQEEASADVKAVNESLGEGSESEADS